MTFLRRIPFLRRLSVALLAVLGLFYGCGEFQMDGTLGRASTDSQRSPYWLTGTVPAGLQGREELPALQAVTYNLHSGLGPDWSLFAPRVEVEANLRAIARRIASAAPGTPPDVIALNEVDFRSRRSGGFDQARFIADELFRLAGHPYRVVAGETWRRDLPGLEVRFGNALLVRHPVIETMASPLGDPSGDLPAHQPAAGLLSRFLGEQRGVVRVTLDFHGHPVDVLATHLEAFVLQQREAQAAEILDRLVRSGVTTILMGDINAVPTAMTARRDHFAADRTHDILTSGPLLDARVTLAARRGAADLSAWATYPAEAPRWPLDAVLGTSDLLPESVLVVGGTDSDHRGLMVRYTLLDGIGAGEQFAWHDSLRRRQLERILADDIAPSGAAREPRIAWLFAATGFDELLRDPAEPATFIQ